MSWSLSVPTTLRENFNEAVDSAVATGCRLARADDVAAAKFALKDLGQRIKRPLVGGYAFGHCLQEGESEHMSDSVSVNVNGSE